MIGDNIIVTVAALGVMTENAPLAEKRDLTIKSVKAVMKPGLLDQPMTDTISEPSVIVRTRTQKGLVSQLKYQYLLREES